MIQIPIEIGDTILVGKFKNKRITVKEIGTDEYGLPTCNGKGIMKIRIEKLMSPKEPKTENNMKKINESEISLKRYFYDNNLQTDDLLGQEVLLNNEKYFVVDLDQMGDTRTLPRTLWISKNRNSSTGNSAQSRELTVISESFKPNKAKLDKMIFEALHSNDTQVKIKQKDKLWWIHQEETDECLNAVGFETKEQAEHSALTKGYSFSGQEEMNEMEPEVLTSKIEKTKGVDKVETMKLDKEKEIKLEILRIAKRVIKEELQESPTWRNARDLSNKNKLNSIAAKKYVHEKLKLPGTTLNSPVLIYSVDENKIEYRLKGEDEIKIMMIESFSKKKVKLNELEITGEDLLKEVEEYARQYNEIERMEEQLAKMKEKIKPMDEKFSTMMAALEKELGSSKETFIRAKNILITIKRKGGDRTSYKYKEAVKWLYDRVNPQMKKLIDEMLEAHKTVTYIKSSLSVQYEANNWLSNLYSKVKNWFVSIVKKIRDINREANSSLDKLESMI